MLDDLFVVRQAVTADAATPLQLYAPPARAMGRPKSETRQFEAANPSPGLPIYYYLSEDLPEGEALSVEILDEAGALLRSYSSEETGQMRCRIAGMDPRKPFTPKYPSAEAGLQRWHWDLHAEDVRCIDDHTLFEGYGGPAVAPGTYTVRITAGTASASAPVEVLADPRVPASAEQTRQWVAMQNDIAGLLDEVLLALENARRARSQVKALAAEHGDDALLPLATAGITAIDAWEAGITELRHETFEDEDAWVMKLDGQLRHLLDVVEDSGAPVTAGAMERYEDLQTIWTKMRQDLDGINAEPLAAINRWAEERSIPHVQTP